MQDVFALSPENAVNNSKGLSNCVKRFENESGQQRAILLNAGNNVTESVMTLHGSNNEDTVAVYLSDVNNFNQNRLESMLRELNNQENQIICSESQTRESIEKTNQSRNKEWKILVPDMADRDDHFRLLQSILHSCETLQNNEKDNSFTKSYNKKFCSKVEDRTKLLLSHHSLYCIAKEKDESFFSFAKLNKFFFFPVCKVLQDLSLRPAQPMTENTKRRRLQMRRRAEERYNTAISSESSDEC